MAVWAVAISLAAMQTQSAPVPDLRWMAGDWWCEAGNRRRGTAMILEEIWLRGASVPLVGVGRASRTNETISLEHMRIDADASGRLVFYGSPMGRPAVAFTLTRSGATELIFENPRHDEPQRISYRLEGEALVGETSQLDGSRRQRWRFTRRGRGNGPQPCQATSR